MITVSSAMFQRHFGEYSDKALQEPVAITRSGRERIVLVSAEEYSRLKRRAREVLHVSDLSEEDLEAIAKVEMASQHAHLNSELP